MSDEESEAKLAANCSESNLVDQACMVTAVRRLQLCVALRAPEGI